MMVHRQDWSAGVLGGVDRSLRLIMVIMLYATHPRYLTTTEWSTLYGGKRAGMFLHSLHVPCTIDHHKCAAPQRSSHLCKCSTCTCVTRTGGGVLPAASKSATDSRAQFRRLPFYCCSLSLQPFDHPYCTEDGFVFDLL